jgi:simple sugar transport system permease protein
VSTLGTDSTTTDDTTTSAPGDDGNPPGPGSAPSTQTGSGGSGGGVAGRAMARDITGAVLVPVAGLLVALVVGGLLISWIGEQPLDVYADVVHGVFVAPRGLSDTATAATPLLLIALGYAFAYRARVFTIGAEGQYVVAAAASVGVVTSGVARDLPGPILIVVGLLVAAGAGALWSGVSGVLYVRFGASVVISSLMLVYVGEAVLQWATRVGIRDPESFVPLSRSVGDAMLPTVPGLDVHLGFVLAVLLVPVMTWVLARHRFGFRIRALGHNPEAVEANEVPAGRIVIAVLLFSGALAGLAGFIEIAGVNGKLNDAASLGYGFSAIIVALVGRLHPVGVLFAALMLAALDIGFEVAARSSDLPTSMAGLIQVLVVIFVVAGDALLERRRRHT